MNVFWIITILYFVSSFRNSKSQKRIIYIGLFWLGITSTKFIPDLMVYSLEKQYCTLNLDFDTLGNESNILVLGGGGVYDIEISSQERLSHIALARLSEGLRIYHEIGHSKLIFSGNSSTKDITQAEITRDAAISLGIPKEDIYLLEMPSTTEEEAKEYKAVFGNSKSNLILVTSDIHMSRAMYFFRKQGLNPIAAPSDHILKTRYYQNIKFDKNVNSSKTRNDFWWESQISNFEKFYSAMHEYIGLLWAMI